MRRAFTLIELLIVIFLLGVLIALTVPAILAARGASRQATCLNRQHELQGAIASYEQAKNRLPGWREQLGRPGNVKDVSWTFVLLPYLGRQEISRRYAPGGDAADQQPGEFLELFICPDDSVDATTAPLSYAVNCGLQDAANITLFGRLDLPANGLFHDQRPPAGWQRQPQVQMRTTDVADGAGCTLSLSDRTEVVRWTDWQSERRVGLWWQNTLNPPAEAVINGVKPPLPESNRPEHVRPSSGHAAGVVVGFADGSGKFLDEKIDYLVYALLMTPHGAKAELPEGGPVEAAFRTTALPEGVLGN